MAKVGETCRPSKEGLTMQQKQGLEGVLEQHEPPEGDFVPVEAAERTGKGGVPLSRGKDSCRSSRWRQELEGKAERRDPEASGILTLKEPRPWEPLGLLSSEASGSHVLRKRCSMNLLEVLSRKPRPSGMTGPCSA